MADEYSGLNFNAHHDAMAVEALAEFDIDKHAEIIAFHAQQAAEKQLKEALKQHGAVPPKTHHVAHLVTLCQSEDMFVPTAEQMQSALRLTSHAVTTRYDEEIDIGKGEALEAIADCNAIADMLEQAGFQPVRIDVEARFLRDDAAERQEDMTEE